MTSPSNHQHNASGDFLRALETDVKRAHQPHHPHPKGTPRTARQEFRFGQALAYAWGRRDACPKGDHDTLKTGSVEFATFYAMAETIAGDKRSIQDAFDYFRLLRKDEQEAYYHEWQRPTFPGIYDLTH